MRKLLLFVAVAFSSGCGIYIHHGGGEYTFIGLGSSRVAHRCSAMAQDTTWRW